MWSRSKYSVIHNVESLRYAEALILHKVHEDIHGHDVDLAHIAIESRCLAKHHQSISLSMMMAGALAEGAWAISRKATDSVTTIGIDIGKNTFHLIGLNAERYCPLLDCGWPTSPFNLCHGQLATGHTFTRVSNTLI